MRWRQDEGEFSPAVWLAGGFGFVTIVALAIVIYRWIGVLPMLIAEASWRKYLNLRHDELTHQQPTYTAE